MLTLWASLLVTLLAAPSLQLHAQDTQTNDSITTPFQKGKWLSGLGGSFSSSNLRLESEDALLTNNTYGLEVFTGVFFKDRWFAGFSIAAVQTGGKGLIERESETLIIGPSISRYFLKEPYGSLYVSVLPGYIRIREEGRLGNAEGSLRQVAEGPGFVTRVRLGYAYVISNRIVLDIGIGTNLAWLNFTYQNEFQQVTRNESIFSESTFFSFGFNVLLDEFFF